MTTDKVIERVFRASQVFRQYPLCHSLPDRSYCYNGRYFGLCARCTPLYIVGILVLAIIHSGIWWPMEPKMGITIGLALIAPGAIDGFTQLLGNRESTNRLRTITGAMMGAGVPLVVHGVFIGMV